MERRIAKRDGGREVEMATAKKRRHRRSSTNPPGARPSRAFDFARPRPARPPEGSHRPGHETPLRFRTASEWDGWLRRHHASSVGEWLSLAKKGSADSSLTYAEAIEVALAWGWIDGQKRAGDGSSWLQRFTPRSARSIWSKINREKAMALIAAGRMQPPGLAEVERAKKDGRWESAYDGARTSTVPPDLAAALERHSRAASFFAGLDAGNRYAILWRVQTAKKPETRARRIAEYVAMCARGETIHPPRKRKAPHHA
jgi:uncharacterized protein YdeI (YjbR/CyaY-like superfamily)